MSRPRIVEPDSPDGGVPPSRPGEAPSTLKVPFHPGLVLGLFVGAAWALARIAPIPIPLPDRWLPILPWFVFTAAFALAAWSFWTFRKGATSADYGRKVRTLLTGGPYRFSRNPLFLTNALLFLGLTLVLDNAWALSLFPALLLTLDRLVVRREEAFLARTFGEDYARYCRRVRRWL
ncbi:MAG: isoprenylcysteine carboxylmethyltransferase family protein [Acidobacteria bacterium]|nr:isoprenylcysteine carboxylmethyltransferase family protein [Acidobacteriota bacterium]